MKGYNVFLYQNIIMHYKYLNNNLRTFVKFLDQLIYALFRPAPADLYLHPATRIFTCAPPRGFSPVSRLADFHLCSAPPRPAGKSSALPIPGVNSFGQPGRFFHSCFVTLL